ncbi:hypothetical protein SEA_DATTRAN_3 [Streptomyces phage Dattran]|nr:hypothetical protein SEA_DATTRAN_3 [Streptomyces phage Dattran]
MSAQPPGTRYHLGAQTSRAPRPEMGKRAGEIHTDHLGGTPLAVIAEFRYAQIGRVESDL